MVNIFSLYNFLFEIEISASNIYLLPANPAAKAFFVNISYHSALQR